MILASSGVEALETRAIVSLCSVAIWFSSVAPFAPLSVTVFDFHRGDFPEPAFSGFPFSLGVSALLLQIEVFLSLSSGSIMLFQVALPPVDSSIQEYVETCLFT